MKSKQNEWWNLSYMNLWEQVSDVTFFQIINKCSVTLTSDAMSSSPLICLCFSFRMISIISGSSCSNGSLPVHTDRQLVSAPADLCMAWRWCNDIKCIKIYSDHHIKSNERKSRTFWLPCLLLIRFSSLHFQIS